MTKNTPLKIIKFNILVSLILKGVSVITSLLLIPLTISYVDTIQYGVWLTLSSMIAWVNIMDIGLANGLKNKIAEANANGKAKEINAYISTAYAALILISITIFLTFYLLNNYINWNIFLNINNAEELNLHVISLVIVGSFCIQFSLQPLMSMLNAFHAAATTSAIYTIGQFGCLIGIYILTKYSSGSLLYLILTLTGIPLFTQIVATIWFFKRKYSNYKPSYSAMNLNNARELLKMGGTFFFVQIGALLLFQTDNIIITQLFGPEQVAVFNTAYKLFSIISMIFTIAMTPLWPVFTEAYARNDMQWIKIIFIKIYKYFVILMICSLILLAMSSLIFDIWLGEKIYVPLKLSVAMNIYVVAICWMTIHNYFINGVGKMRLQMYLYFASTAINIPLALILGSRLGMIGVVLSNIFVVVVMGEILRLQSKRIINRTADGIWNV